MSTALSPILLHPYRDPYDYFLPRHLPPYQTQLELFDTQDRQLN